MEKQINHAEVFRNWVAFFEKKGSIFFDGFTEPVDPAMLKTAKKTKRTNSHFTVCGFPKGSRKKAHLANRFHAFFFDVDLKRNPWKTKRSMEVAIRNIGGMFDFIVETRNGFHLYVLASEGKYLSTQSERYLEDRNDLWNRIAISTWLVLDDVSDLSRIAKIPGCWHRKDGDTSPFQIKLLKGAELLAYNGNKRLALINSVPLASVFEKLGVSVSGERIVQNGQPTAGWKVETEKNFVNDFSHHGERPIGWPFAFVLRRFRQSLHSKEPEKTAERIENMARMRTYAFFAEHFGIMPVGAKDRKIPVPVPVERLLSDPELPGKDVKVSLWFFKAVNRRFENSSPYWKTAEMRLSDFASAISLPEASDAFANYLNGYGNRIPKLYGKPIVRFETEKRGKEWRILFSVLSLSAFGKKLNKVARGHHYVSVAALLLPTNGVSIRFYLFLCSKFLFDKDKKDLELRKSKVLRFFWNANYRRDKRTIRKIVDTTQDFRMKSVKYGVVFGKGKKPESDKAGSGFGP